VTEWQDILIEAFPGIEGRSDLEVAFTSSGEDIRLGLRAGQLEIRDPSHAPDPDPDLEVRLHSLALKDLLLGRVTTEVVFVDAEVRVGNGWGPALPAGECELSGSTRFDHIPGASMSVGITVNGTMFGAAGLWEEWRDGALVSSELVPISKLPRDELDVQLVCSLAQLAAIRRRELTLLEGVANGMGLLGDWPVLMCFAELVSHPVFARVWTEIANVDAQVAWGATFCTQAYGDAALKALLESVVAR
jgi:hypothetical protein